MPLEHKHSNIPAVKQMAKYGLNLIKRTLTHLDARPDRSPRAGLRVPEAGVLVLEPYAERVAGVRPGVADLP